MGPLSGDRDLHPWRGEGVVTPYLARLMICLVTLAYWWSTSFPTPLPHISCCVVVSHGLGALICISTWVLRMIYFAVNDKGVHGTKIRGLPARVEAISSRLLVLIL